MEDHARTDLSETRGRSTGVSPYGSACNSSSGNGRRSRSALRPRRPLILVECRQQTPFGNGLVKDRRPALRASNAVQLLCRLRLEHRPARSLAVPFVMNEGTFGSSKKSHAVVYRF